MVTITAGSFPIAGPANDGPRRECWWACEEGWWQHFSSQSPSRFNRADPNDSFPGRVLFFETLKMVRRSVDGGRLTLKWHVEEVSDGALGAALRYLEDSAPRGRPVRLIFNFGGWHSEDVETPELAIKRMRGIQDLQGVSPVLSTQLRKHDLARVETSPTIIQEGLRAWRHSAGHLEARAAAPLLPRSLIFSFSERLGDLVFEHIGHLSLFAETYGPGWPDVVRGRRTDEGMPGQQIDERRLSAPYWDVLNSGEPSFEHARVPIREKTGETTWRTYHRLLLPLRSPTGRPQLLCLCAQTQHVDLPAVFDPA